MLAECLRSLGRAQHDFEITISLANSGGSINLPDDPSMSLFVKAVPNNFFWADAMYEASTLFNQERGFDYALWLNEDVTLAPNSLRNMVRILETGRADIVVGQTYSRSGSLTYGGFTKESAFKPLHFKRVHAISDSIRADTFNGNIVLIGDKALRKIGPFIKGYRHYLADIAYGLEASRNGLKMLVAPGSSGICEENSKVNKTLDVNVERKKRLSHLNKPDGIPVIPQWNFSTRYGGVFGIIYLLATYIRFFATLLIYRK
jgi:GT2 family glycosyltransferase